MAIKTQNNLLSQRSMFYRQPATRLKIVMTFKSWIIQQFLRMFHGLEGVLLVVCK